MEAFWARAIFYIVVNGVALDFIRPWTSMFMSMAAAAAAAMRCSFGFAACGCGWGSRRSKRYGAKDSATSYTKESVQFRMVSMRWKKLGCYGKKMRWGKIRKILRDLCMAGKFRNGGKK